MAPIKQFLGVSNLNQGDHLEDSTARSSTSTIQASLQNSPQKRSLPWKTLPWMSKHAYKALNEDDEQSQPWIEKGEGFEKRSSRRGWHTTVFAILPWALALFFASIALYGRLEGTGPANSLGTFQSGWTTDLAASRPHVQAELVRFTGSPAFDDDGDIIIPHPDPIDYSGDGPEVDQAWEALTGGRYILITEEEARDAWGEGYKEFWDEERGGFVAGLDMFHTLHCVNRLRQMTPESLRMVQESHNHRLHFNHCLSQIRQFIMCTGDMTAIPTKFFPGINRNYVDSDYHHTCRNFGQLRGWLWDRYNGSSAVPRQSRPF